MCNGYLWLKHLSGGYAFEFLTLNKVIRHSTNAVYKKIIIIIYQSIVYRIVIILISNYMEKKLKEDFDWSYY